MPATREQIRRARVIGHLVDFGEGVTVQFWYDRNKITDAWVADWTEQEQQAGAARMNEMISDLLDRWDVLEYDGGPVVPLSAKTIGELFSWPDKIHLMRELMTSGIPTSEEGNGSSDTSSTASTDSLPRPETLQNGPEPSPSPVPSTSPSPT
jgi:hypothetical protein